MAAPDSFALAYTGHLPSLLALVGPGLTPFSIAAGAGDLAQKPRFIHVSGAAGAITYQANGVAITETLEVGYHPIRPDKVTAIAGGTTVTGWV
ncbi:MAG TPA: hypothetical protein VEW68_05440, partial [Patescibacteria group bacterium]|nr:hypothetical protein [Patescibacteria group bacterium]